MLNEVYMGGMVGDEIVSLPSHFIRLTAHPCAIAAFDFIGAFSAVPTPAEPRP